jgi:uncharacterized protein
MSSDDQNKLITQTADFINSKFSSDHTGRDWWHMYRVWQMAKVIAKTEPVANMLVVELAALLHDIADWKFNDNDDNAGPAAATTWLVSLGAPNEITEQVAYIVRYISYKGGTNNHQMETLEGKIVQDADRLDAIGAIGIARTFAFGGSKGRDMYDPDNLPRNYEDFEDFKAQVTGGTTINHFYEKLLKLKDGMHTKKAKELAQQRHQYMEEFLKQFYDEWQGKR